MAKTTKNTEIDVVTLSQGEVKFCILGVSPFYCNRVQEKAKRELLMPRGRLTGAQKAANLKHDPVSEYRNSPYRRVGDGPTRIMMKATAFKGAMAAAATDMPTTVARAQINRLVWVVGEWVPIWGIPRLNMDIVRSADMNKTPDIRTRAKLDEWAAEVTLRYTEPMLNPQAVATLMAAAGMIIGVGDFRQEKGKGSNGQFTIVPADDPDFLRIKEMGGIAAQDDALTNPVCSDGDTEELLEWFNQELAKRSSGKAKAVNEDDADDDTEDVEEAA